MDLQITPTFQRQILSLLVQDHDILTKYRSNITPDIFEHPMYRGLSRLVLEFYDQYDSVPNEDSLHTITENFLNSRNDPAKVQLEFLTAVKEVYHPLGSGDRSFVRDNFQAFLKEQLLQSAVYKASQYIGEEKYDRILPLFEQASHFSFNDEESTILRWETLQHFDYDSRVEEPAIPTGWGYLDRDLHGGSRSGELGFIVASTGAGKSMVLVNLAKGALIDDKKVLYITLEISDRAVAQRLDSSISGIDYWTLSDPFQYELARKSVQNFISSKPNASLNVKFWPTRSKTVGEISQFIRKLADNQQQPEMVIVDYGDIIRPGQTYNSKYEELGTIYEELVGLGQKWKVPVWTASQGNRQALTTRNVDLQHLADSFKKAFVADIVLCLSQTDQEKASRLFRLHSAKCRSHSSDQTYYFQINYNKCQINNIAEADYNAYAKGDVSVKEMLGNGNYKAFIKSNILKGNKQ